MREPGDGSDFSIGGQGGLEMRLRVVEATTESRQPTERERDRAVGVGIAQHGVLGRIGGEQPIKNLRVFHFVEIRANVGEDEHRRQPVPIARHQAEIVLGELFKFNSRLFQLSKLEQAELQPASRKHDQGILRDETSQRRLEVSQTPALPQRHSFLDEI